MQFHHYSVHQMESMCSAKLPTAIWPKVCEQIHANSTRLVSTMSDRRVNSPGTSALPEKRRPGGVGDDIRRMNADGSSAFVIRTQLAFGPDTGGLALRPAHPDILRSRAENQYVPEVVKLLLSGTTTGRKKRAQPPRQLLRRHNEHTHTHTHACPPTASRTMLYSRTALHRNETITTMIRLSFIHSYFRHK